MPALRAASAPMSETSAPIASRSYAAALVVGGTALAAVVVGFALVALSVLDLSSVPLGWGVGLCLAGSATATMRRTARRSA